jgi:prolyl oligopeptidase
MRLNVAVAGLLFCGGILQGAAQTVEVRGGNGVVLGAPPPVTVKPVTENVGGHQITDNYRWLEDQTAPDTRAFIAAQTQYTDSYFAQIKPLKERLVSRLREMSRVDSVGAPSEVHGRFFYAKRLAEENQASIYMRVGLDGAEVKLVDASTLSADGNTSVGIEDISQDGKLLAYSVRHGGADEGVIQFLNVDTRKALNDVLPLARYSGFGFSGKTAFYGKLLPSGAAAVFSHVLGESAEKDLQIFGGSYKGATLGPLDLVGCGVSENGHWLVVSIAHGVPATREDILLKDLRKPDGAFEPLVYGVDSRFNLQMYGDEMFVSTDYGAPNSKVLRASLGDPTTKSWPVVIPEGTTPIVCGAAGRCEIGDNDLHAGG